MIFVESPRHTQSTPAAAAEAHCNPQRIGQLVQSLSALHDAPQAALELIACGQDAVAPLREFLFRREPSGIYEPRCWAVRVLARIGACEVLVEFISADRQISDPVERLGEEAVINSAARALVQAPSEQAYTALLTVARRRPLPGVIETLAEFQRAETVPLFIAALEDDVARIPAEDALRRFGAAAARALVDAALLKVPPEGESPSSLRRRRSALRLVAEMRGAETFRDLLQPLTEDNDENIAAVACMIVLECGTQIQKQRAVEILINCLGTADWLLRAEMENALVRNFKIAGPAIGRIAAADSTPAASRRQRSIARVLARAESEECA